MYIFHYKDLYNGACKYLAFTDLKLFFKMILKIREWENLSIIFPVVFLILSFEIGNLM